MRVYVGNLPFSTDGDELRSIFSNYGQVDNAEIVMDRQSGRSRGFGFVEMSSDDDARRAIDELNETDLGGRNLVVNEARPREDRRGGGGGGGGRGPRRDRW